MKEGIVVTSIITGMIAFTVWMGWDDSVRHRRCGYIADKFISNPYEHRVGKMVNVEESKMYIIFKSDSDGYMRIECNVDEFYGHKIGERVCYNLSNNQVHEYKK